MNNQEARFILQAYRHGGQDAGDPAFKEALEQARRDPELGRWLADEMEFDAAMARKLKELPVPPHLKGAILAGRKIATPQRWGRSRLWLPLAACFVLLLGILGWQLNWADGDPVAKARRELLTEIQSYPKHVDHMADDLKSARDWLAKNQADPDFVLPDSLSGIAEFGCRVIPWRNTKAAMLCLFINGEHFDLVVFDRTAVPDFPVLAQARFVRDRNVNTAMWSEGEKVYLLASSVKGDPRDVLGKML